MENLPETLGMTLGIGDIVGELPISVKANGMIPGFQHSKCDFKFLHPKNLSLFVGGKGVLMPGVPVARNAAAEPGWLCRRLMLLVKTEMKIYVYNREQKQLVEEDAYKINGLLFLYKTLSGKILTNVILKRRFISAAYGRMMKSKRSIKQISEFIKHYNIDVNEVKRPLGSFKSFNDFFVRELKPEARPLDQVADHLVSPADSRLLVLDLANYKNIPVKGYWYQLSDLVKDVAIAEAYGDGLCFIYRLAPSDYHRYGYIDNGTQDKVNRINGVLHSVNRIAIAEMDAIMAKNYRELTVLHTENFGDVIHIEVGALFVGKIVQRFNDAHTYKRGEEKGWFEFGGSTVIQLFKKGSIVTDADIMDQSERNVETLVKIGEKVGVKTKSTQN